MVWMKGCQLTFGPHNDAPIMLFQLERAKLLPKSGLGSAPCPLLSGLILCLWHSSPEQNSPPQTSCTDVPYRTSLIPWPGFISSIFSAKPAGTLCRTPEIRKWTYSLLRIPAPKYLWRTFFIPFTCVHHLPLVLKGLRVVEGGLWAVFRRAAPVARDWWFWIRISIWMEEWEIFLEAFQRCMAAASLISGEGPFLLVHDSWGDCSANHRSSLKFLDVIEKIPALCGQRGIRGVENWGECPHWDPGEGLWFQILLSREWF